jgi:spermidine synthase
MAQTEQTFDVVFVDGFDQHGMPEQLCSPQFYSDCRRVLTVCGMAVANLHRFSAYRDVYVDRIEAAFDGAMWVVNAPGTTNCVVFAMDGFSKDTKLSYSKHKPAHMSDEAWAQISPSVARTFLATQEKSKS